MSQGTSFHYPVTSPITQGFGDRPEYYQQYGQLGHTGIDFGSPIGTRVYASNDGTVKFQGYGAIGAAGYKGWYGVESGLVILIDHPEVYTSYAHLSSTIVNDGQYVTQGQHIGYTGNTGATQGPHIHFEFIGKQPNFKNGYDGRVDPAPYIGENVDKITISKEEYDDLVNSKKAWIDAEPYKQAIITSDAWLTSMQGNVDNAKPVINDGYHFKIDHIGDDSKFKPYDGPALFQEK